MGFSLGAAIDYDPHRVISKRIQENKNKTFEHTEVPGLGEEANWEDYPNNTPYYISMEQDCVSPVLGNDSSPMDLSNIVAVVGNISSLVIFFRKLKEERTFKFHGH